MGKSRRVPGDNTKMDQWRGDQIKAYVTKDSYTSTIQQVIS